MMLSARQVQEYIQQGLACDHVEVRGEDGGPPYLVRFDDGHETLLFPGADCVFEHEQSAG